jgi:hypothetical protein
MCRQLKAKCDELKPCKSCKEKKVECKYREAVPKQCVSPPFRPLVSWCVPADHRPVGKTRSR